MGNDNSKSRFDEQYTDEEIFSDANIVKNITSFFTQYPEINISYNTGQIDHNAVTSSLQISEGPLVVPRSREYRRYKEDVMQRSPGIEFIKLLTIRNPERVQSETELDRATLARLVPPSIGVTRVEEPSVDISPQISKHVDREPSEFDSIKNEISVSVNEFLEKPAVVGTKFPVSVPEPPVAAKQPPQPPQPQQPQQIQQQAPQIPTVVIAPFQMQPVQPAQPVQQAQPVQPVQPAAIPEPVFEPPLNSSLTPVGQAKQEKDETVQETLAQAGGCPCSQDAYSATSLLSQQGGGSELMNLLPFSSSSGGASDYYRSMQNALRYT